MNTCEVASDVQIFGILPFAPTLTDDTMTLHFGVSTIKLLFYEVIPD